jgi:hypothetical protein
MLTRLVSAAATLACINILPRKCGRSPIRLSTGAQRHGRKSEDCMTRALDAGKELLIINIDVAKVFDKLNTGRLINYLVRSHPRHTLTRAGTCTCYIRFKLYTSVPEGAPGKSSRKQTRGPYLAYHFHCDCGCHPDGATPGMGGQTLGNVSWQPHQSMGQHRGVRGRHLNRCTGHGHGDANSPEHHQMRL